MLGISYCKFMPIELATVCCESRREVRRNGSRGADGLRGPPRERGLGQSGTGAGVHCLAD